MSEVSQFSICCHDDLPDYFNDLNAMHRAERFLSENEMKVYKAWIGIIVGDSFRPAAWKETICATAEQRAEAFKTKNL